MTGQIGYGTYGKTLYCLLSFSVHLKLNNDVYVKQNYIQKKRDGSTVSWQEIKRCWECLSSLQYKTYCFYSHLIQFGLPRSKSWDKHSCGRVRMGIIPSEITGGEERSGSRKEKKKWAHVAFEPSLVEGNGVSQRDLQTVCHFSE